MKNLMRKNRRVLESGSGIQFNVLVGQSNAAANTVWRNSQTSYMVIHQLMSMNREPARIVDFVKQQRIMALISLAELMEQNFWGAPSATDQLTPLGIPYWIVKNATKGFNGGNLSGYTSVANLSNATYPNWANWTAPYTNVSKDDFIRAVREAATKTDFQPPVDGIPSPDTGDEYGFYTVYSVIQPLEEAVESQNDNLGRDVASQDGKVLFRRVPVSWVPFLEPDTTNPFYGINWGWLKLYILRGEWLRETNIPYTPGQHNVASHFLDCTYEIVSLNRRPHFVASNGTTYPA